MRISDWSSDVCSSDLGRGPARDDGSSPAATAATCVGQGHDDPEVDLLVGELVGHCLVELEPQAVGPLTAGQEGHAVDHRIEQIRELPDPTTVDVDVEGRGEGRVGAVDPEGNGARSVALVAEGQLDGVGPTGQQRVEGERRRRLTAPGEVRLLRARRSGEGENERGDERYETHAGARSSRRSSSAGKKSRQARTIVIRADAIEAKPTGSVTNRHR